MSSQEIQALRKDIQELKDAIHAVNDRIQTWTDNDYRWKKDEVSKRQALEETMQPIVQFFDDWTRAKKVLLWIIGGISAAIAFYLLLFEFVKTFMTK